jgi:uncharacterized membrane protein YfcA
MMDFLLLLVFGGLAGVLAGLLGIGGGIIIVPVLAQVFIHQGVAPAVLMHVAIGTSLATIVVTSMSSIRAHQRRGAIEWQVVRNITPGIIAGGLAGAGIATLLPGDTLRVVFAIFLLIVALRMVQGGVVPAHRKLPGAAGMLGAGGVIGTVSTLMGVGGGTMSVPFLTWCNVAVRHAVATSAAIGLPIALTGAVSYAITGWGRPELPAWSVGYINLPALLGIVVASILAAPLGAALAHRIDPTLLKRLFALFLVIMGIRLLLL